MDDRPYEIFEEDGKLYGRDDHGEFALDAGSTTPVEGRCNATLKFCQQRYGEQRFCTQYVKNDEYCRFHRGYKNSDKMREDNFETGAYSESYTHLFNFLDPHKQVVAVSLFKDLMDESVYDFEEVMVNETIDTSDVEWTDDDIIVVEFPVATQHKHRAKALWFAALEFIKIENVEIKLFEDAFASDTGVGERDVLHSVSEFGETRDMGEHHLNLPLSRMLKDHKELLKIGGVDIGSDMEETASTVVREWVYDVGTPQANPDPFHKNHDE